MIDFSIHESIVRISSEKTRKYFEEVSSSYYNGNYRAAIVTLYSVVICDIINKLEVLDEIYQDTAAKSILKEMKALQEANPTGSDWEKEIIEKIKIRTNLIDNSDYTLIKSLQQLRHLCAHPVINKDKRLYTPNKETAAAYLRNMMEALLLKPPLLSKKILPTILVDVASKKEILIDKSSLQKYIVAKYLNNLSASVEVDLFRELWKFVFRMESPEAIENRIINYRVLFLLYRRNTRNCIDKISKEQSYFSNINNNSTEINLFIRFISESEFLYKEFREDVHLLVTNQVKKDVSAKTVAWFLSDSYIDHLEVMKKIILDYYDGDFNQKPEVSASKRIINIGFSKGYIKELCNYLIWRYSTARNYNDADAVFSYELKPKFKHFTNEQLVELCKESEKNPQTYDRSRAQEDHTILFDFCKAKIADFNPSIYASVFKANL